MGTLRSDAFDDRDVGDYVTSPTESTAPTLAGKKGPNGVIALSLVSSPVNDADRSSAPTPLSCVISDTSRVVKCSSRSWLRGEVLGRGALGTVFKARDQQTQQLIAVKEVQIDQRQEIEMEFRRALENEIEINEGLTHPHVVTYFGHDYTDSVLYVYLEFMPGGSLAHALSSFGPFEECLIAKYTRQLLDGLEYLHTRQPVVLHRDIKGANILMGNDCEAKLSDFGCSKRTHDTMAQSLRGSINWMAPEVIKQSGCGRRSDIWSLGCVVIEMATAKPPWPDFNSTMAAAIHIGTSESTPACPEWLSDTCVRFIRLCTLRDREERPFASTLLQHEFVQDVGPQGSTESIEFVSVDSE